MNVCAACGTANGQNYCVTTKRCSQPTTYAKLTFDGVSLGGSGTRVGGCYYRGVCNITADGETELSGGSAELFLKLANEQV